ncbi:MAG: hypothetical protein QXU80_03935, partial [Zestosphaera sp.]
MEASQLKEVLEVVEGVSRKSDLLDFDYCVSVSDEVVNYVSSSLSPLRVTQVIQLKLAISLPNLRVP